MTPVWVGVPVAVRLNETAGPAGALVEAPGPGRRHYRELAKTLVVQAIAD